MVTGFQNEHLSLLLRARGPQFKGVEVIVRFYWGWGLGEERGPGNGVSRYHYFSQESLGVEIGTEHIPEVYLHFVISNINIV